MRLPWRPVDEPLRLLPPVGPAHDAFTELWERCRADGRGIIVVSGHIGSIEIFAGSYALQGDPDVGPRRRHRLPRAVRAAERATGSLGGGHHPVAQPARGLPGAAEVGGPGHGRRLGLPARGRAGPAVRRLDHAARGTRHARRADACRDPARRRLQAARRPVPSGRRRRPSRSPTRRRAHWPSRPRPSPTPSSRSCATAPEQWHTFKPMWPATDAEARLLEQRALAMLADRRSGTTGARRSRMTVPTTRPRPRRAAVARCDSASRAGRSSPACGCCSAFRTSRSTGWRISCRPGLSYLMPERRALVRANLGRVCRALDASGTGDARTSVPRRATDGGSMPWSATSSGTGS